MPIFARGADWIPCDSFVGAIGPERYTALLERAREGNMNMLRVWGGGIYEHDHFYAECEFGMHAAPVAETLQRAIPSDQLCHHSPAMDWHNKDNPKNKGDDLMLSTTGLPDSLEQYITFSQIAQAEGLKFGVEHFRRRKPHCSGTLVWQLDDCWPVLSWSVLDYNGFGKAGYYYLRRAYAPVLASFKRSPDGALELWVTNDTLADVRDTATVRLATFSGQVVWEATRDVHVPAGASCGVWCWSSGELPGGANHYLSVRSGSGLFAPNRNFFTAIKDLVRQPGVPEMSVEAASSSAMRLKLRALSDRYVYFAHLTSPSESTRFSDNYFDLEPGDSRDILVTDPVRELTPAGLGLGWA